MSAAILHPMPSKAPAEPAPASVHSITKRQVLDPALRECRRADLDLVREILEGQGEGFERLYELYSQRIYRFAVKRLGDAVEAEDVVQDTFLEVHRCLASWQGRSSLLTWMFGIAHHQLCRRFRKKTPVGMPMELLELAPPRVPEVPGEQRLDAMRAISMCADALDEDVSDSQRQIFNLYYGESHPTRQIAKDLGKSNQAIKISLFRTRRAMQARLEARQFRNSA